MYRVAAVREIDGLGKPSSCTGICPNLNTGSLGLITCTGARSCPASEGVIGSVRTTRRESRSTSRNSQPHVGAYLKIPPEAIGEAVVEDDEAGGTTTLQSRLTSIEGRRARQYSSRTHARTRHTDEECSSWPVVKRNGFRATRCRVPALAWHRDAMYHSGRTAAQVTRTPRRRDPEGTRQRRCTRLRYHTRTTGRCCARRCGAWPRT